MKLLGDQRVPGRRSEVTYLGLEQFHQFAGVERLSKHTYKVVLLIKNVPESTSDLPLRTLICPRLSKPANGTPHAINLPILATIARHEVAALRSDCIAWPPRLGCSPAVADFWSIVARRPRLARRVSSASGVRKKSGLP